MQITRSRTALMLAHDEARTLGHSYVGTEHLLLGIMRVEDGVGAVVLQWAGVKIDAVRGQVQSILKQPAYRRRNILRRLGIRAD